MKPLSDYSDAELIGAAAHLKRLNELAAADAQQSAAPGWGLILALLASERVRLHVELEARGLATG